MGAQKHARAVRLLVEIKRVVLLPGRVLGGHVERAEIIKVILDVRPFGDIEAQVAPDLNDLLPHVADRVDGAAHLGADRQGDINAFRLQPQFKSGAAQHLLALGEGRGDLGLQLVELGSKAPALLGLHCGERLHPVGNPALFAEACDAQLLKVCLAWRRGDGRENVGLESFGG